MKMPSFRYLRPCSLVEAASLLEQYGDAAQILAGGQSLLPTLSLRLSHPSILIDINRVKDSAQLEECEGVLRCGALVRHAELERSALTRRRVPLLAMALPHVAHMAIRNRGTPCGSVALADPAAEIPACAVALEAEVVLQGVLESRVITAEDFFLGLYETARSPTEVVAELRFPVAGPTDRFGFIELARRRGDFAVVGIAARAYVHDGRVADMRCVIFGCEPKPRVSKAAAELARDAPVGTFPINAVADAMAVEADPMENAQGDAVTKRQQTRTLAARLLTRMFTECAA